MPRLPIDYANTVIYKIVCNDLSITELYVGHTTDFVRRKQSHKNDCVYEAGKTYNLKVYKTIRENGGWVNYSMIEIEKYPCKDTNEARAKEREWYEVLNSKLNTICPIIVDGEDRRIRRILHVANYRKKYKDENYRPFICQCGRETNKNHKTRHLKTDVHKQYINTMMLEGPPCDIPFPTPA